MGQIVHTYSLQTLKHMQRSYKDMLEQSPQGALFRARTEHAVITAYRSGKVLFQGKSPEKEAKKWEALLNHEVEKPQTVKRNKKVDKIYAPPFELAKQTHIGSDESGTGDYFGPITTCCTLITQEQIEPLKGLGIQDSKKITDDNIKTLAQELIKRSIPYVSVVLDNEKYNMLQKKGWTQGKMKAMLHHYAIKNLMKKLGHTNYHGILIDQFCEPHVYKKHLATEGETLPDHTYFMTKAEDFSIAVAAGSIIARARFLQEMNRLSEQIGFTLLKGASNQVDQLAAQIISAKGEAILPSIAKVHFANTKKAKQYLL